MTPRGYQTDGFNAIISAWDEHQAVVYQLPTGGGKSIIFRMITDWAYSSGRRVLILAHLKNLIRQASEHVSGAGINHGLIGPDWPMVPMNVQVGSVQTVATRLGRIQTPDIIVIDEAHHARATTYERILAAFPDAIIIGVTATPERTDGKGLGDIFQTMIQGPSMRWLIGEGYLSPYRYYAPPSVVPEGANVDDDDEMLDIVDKPKITGDAIEQWRKHGRGMPTLAACIDIRHAEHVAHAFRSAGIRSVALHSGLDAERVASILAELRMGRYEVATFCDMIGEGFDVHGIGGLIKLRPTGSLTIDMQHNGRPLRPDYGPGEYPTTREDRLRRIHTGPKPYAVFLDHVGNYERHGMPDDDRTWSLDGKAGRGGERSTLKRCPTCFRMSAVSARVCQYCGEPFPDPEGRELPEHVDGELVEVGASRSLYDAIKEGGWSVVQSRGIARTMGFSAELGERIFFEVFAR